ncbi:MAG: tetratricopeptide repeat protein [Bryobacteraceae bacterium]
MLRILLLTALALPWANAQDPDPAYGPLQKAYDALRAKQYDDAINAFQRAIALAPNRAAIRKDLAYTLLKIGENEAARDQFAEAMRLDPADRHVALEYAFLCYETKQQAIARQVFDRIRKTGDATAEQAFQNIDKPLAEGIERWSKALELSPDNFSAHQELAQLAEQRDELALAADHYEKAWRLRPAERSLLLDLGRVWKALGRQEQANSVLLAASRGAQPRVAERARELLPGRYPYVYEFEGALQLDPDNLNLRREMAYLLLEMGKKAEAEQQFKIINQATPGDLLSAAQLGFLRLSRHDTEGARPLLDQVLKEDDGELSDRVRAALGLPRALRRPTDTPRNRVSIEARTLAEKSLSAGYMKDALKYLRIAQESDPVDFWVMLKLGWAYNILHQDSDAVQWFNLARKSPDPKIAEEADRAYNNLRPGLARFRTTAWMFPFYSSRWHDAFGYAQVKTEFKLGSLPIRPYVSMRMIGDAKGTIGSTLGNPQPQYLSESSFIFGVGIATNTWHGFTGWGEAGEAVKYLSSRKDVGAMIPDYRGGVSFGKGFGHLLNGSHGLFAETNEDGIFVSRFGNDMLLYSQNRTGYTFAPAETFQSQVYWNYGLTADRAGQYWANFVETGPGVRFRVQSMPKSMVFSVNFLRGAYTINEGNPRKPNYFDLRAGFWYAFTR